jgi:hypothetical protein
MSNPSIISASCQTKTIVTREMSNDEAAATFAPPTKTALSSYAAARRYAAETAGAAWNDGENDHTIATDRDSQTKLIAEFAAVQAGLRASPSGWKFAGGEFVGLTNEQMAAVVIAARDHIAGAFAVEQSVCSLIEVGTITTYAEIDAAFSA